MRSIWLIFLIVTVFVSCSKPSDSDKTVKKLDTSFLKLGDIGSSKATSDFVLDSHIHVLDETQNVEIIDSEGTVEIENFDISQLDDGDIIIGNKEDKYLFKYEAKRNLAGSKLKLSPATLADLNKGKESQISINTTPQLDFKASEGRSFVVKQGKAQTSSSQLVMKASGEKDKLNPKGLNIIDFENYELINLSGQGQFLGNGLRNGKKKTFNIQGGKDLKVTIDKGYLELIPTFSGDYEFKPNNMTLRSDFHALVRYDFQVSVESAGYVAGEFSFPLFKSVTIPVRVPGAVPVYIDVELEFPAGVKLSSQNGGKVSFRVKSEYALVAQTFYNTKTGKQIESFYDYVVNNRSIENLQKDKNYIFELFFEPRMQTKFYRVFGPYAYINANVQADIKSPLKVSEKDIFVNFSGGVGMTLDEPIFSSTLVDVKSPALFNLSRGWDIIGPNGEADILKNQLQGDISLEVNQLDEKNRVLLNLRPDNLSVLGKIILYKVPEFGRLVLGKNFSSSGLAYYYPPKVVEGRDSFQVQIVEKGVATKPGRIILNLGQDAKTQNSQELKISLPDYDSQIGQIYTQGQTALKLPRNAYQAWSVNSKGEKKGSDTPEVRKEFNPDLFAYEHNFHPKFFIYSGKCREQKEYRLPLQLNFLEGEISGFLSIEEDYLNFKYDNETVNIFIRKFNSKLEALKIGQGTNIVSQIETIAQTAIKESNQLTSAQAIYIQNKLPPWIDSKADDQFYEEEFSEGQANGFLRESLIRRIEEYLIEREFASQKGAQDEDCF